MGSIMANKRSSASLPGMLLAWYFLEWLSMKIAKPIALILMLTHVFVGCSRPQNRTDARAASAHLLREATSAMKNAPSLYVAWIEEVTVTVGYRTPTAEAPTLTKLGTKRQE